MITQLRGTLIEKQIPQVVVDVNGVGYECEVSLSSFERLPEANQPVILLTHFVVREDAQQLYGFYDQQERKLFRQLIKISGVGPKLALAILSGIAPSQFVECIRRQDVTSLVRIPGVGKKTAERLVVEMRDKLESMSAIDMAVAGSMSLGGLIQSAAKEATDALIALGYKQQQAVQLVKHVAKPDHSAEQIIRLALQGATA